MASPQLEDGYARIANELLEALARTPFNGSQRRILDVIFRECYGRNCGQKMAPLSLRRIAGMTGLDLRQVRREVANLIAAKVIIRQECDGPEVLYGLVKDYDRWTPGKKRLRGGGELTPGGKLTRGVNSPPKEGVNSPSHEGVNSPPYRRKEEKKHLRAKETRATDPRFQAIVNHYCQRYRKKHVERDDFGGRDAKALDNFLRKHPELGLETILHRLDSAFNSTSGYPLEDRFRLWEFLDRHASYADGPRHKRNGNGKAEPASKRPLVGDADPRRQLSQQGEALYKRFQEGAR